MIIEKKFAVNFNGGKFFMTLNNGSTLGWWVDAEQGVGSAPTFWHLYSALAKIQKTLDIFHESRDGETWTPTTGWVRKNLLCYEKGDPWRIIRRKGISGCEDYTITRLIPTSKYGQEKQIATIHISMNGKINQGLHAPVAFVEWLAGELTPPEQELWIMVTELPEEDTREWQEGGMVGNI